MQRKEAARRAAYDRREEEGERNNLWMRVGGGENGKKVLHEGKRKRWVKAGGEGKRRLAERHWGAGDKQVLFFSFLLLRNEVVGLLSAIFPCTQHFSSSHPQNSNSAANCFLKWGRRRMPGRRIVFFV